MVKIGLFIKQKTYSYVTALADVFKKMLHELKVRKCLEFSESSKLTDQELQHAQYTIAMPKMSNNFRCWNQHDKDSEALSGSHLSDKVISIIMLPSHTMIQLSPSLSLIWMLMDNEEFSKITSMEFPCILRDTPQSYCVEVLGNGKGLAIMVQIPFVKCHDRARLCLL